MEIKPLQNKKQQKWVWIAYGIIAMVMVLGIFRNYFTFSINTSDSLPQKIFIVLKHRTPEKGGYLVFRFPGKRFYSAKDLFVKKYVGGTGDFVETRGQEIYLNGQKVATAKEKSLKGVPLFPLNFNGPIPSEKYFVMGESKDSYDSRYDDVGLVDSDHVVGAAYPVF